MLLLDEPLSALDAKVRAQLRDEIRRIQTEVGITTLFVTHDQDEALAIADRVAVIFAGRLGRSRRRPSSTSARDGAGRRLRRPLESSARRGRARRGHGAGRASLLPGSVMDGPVTVLVRPEMVELIPDPAGPDRVIAASFLVRSRGSRSASPTALVLAQVSSADVARFEHGDAVRVGLKPTPALAVKA